MAFCMLGLGQGDLLPQLLYPPSQRSPGGDFQSGGKSSGRQAGIHFLPVAQPDNFKIPGKSAWLA